MTIICYRNGIIAADTAIWSNTVICGHIRKICRGKHGHLGAGAGETSIIQDFLAWVDDGAKGDFNPGSTGEGDFVGILVDPDGLYRSINWRGRRFISGSEFVAHGAGVYIATGALAVGASAPAAVRACITYSGDCGGEVDYLSLKDR